MSFFYDSLETVRAVKRPTKKDYITLTVAIFLISGLAAIFFIFADSIFSGLYKIFYSLMTG